MIMVAGLRPMTKVMDMPPEPKVRAPVLDPTLREKEAVMPLSYPTNKDRLCEQSEPQSYPVVGQARG